MPGRPAWHCTAAPFSSSIGSWKVQLSSSWHHLLGKSMAQYGRVLLRQSVSCIQARRRSSRTWATSTGPPSSCPRSASSTRPSSSPTWGRWIPPLTLPACIALTSLTQLPQIGVTDGPSGLHGPNPASPRPATGAQTKEGKPGVCCCSVWLPVTPLGRLVCSQQLPIYFRSIGFRL